MNKRIIAVCIVVIALAAWANVRTAFLQEIVDGPNDHLAFSPSDSTSRVVVPEHLSYTATNYTSDKSAPTTKILAFADGQYKEYALRWYRRLSSLGYQNHVVVAVDQDAADYLRPFNVRLERLPYPTCTRPEHDSRRVSSFYVSTSKKLLPFSLFLLIKYRRELFARRWVYVYDQLKNGSHVLLSDVDNVFHRFKSMKDMEQSKFDVFHAYSTSYPEDIFYSMGFTVCGGLGWYRSSPKVTRFVGSLLNKCKCLETINCDCYCDDQVTLNELLGKKGKHKVSWDREIPRPKSLGDYPWGNISGVSAKTRHRIHIWDRNLAYRAPLPESCPEYNWVAAPLYVNRSDVVRVWDRLCERE